MQDNPHACESRKCLEQEGIFGCGSLLHTRQKKRLKVLIEFYTAVQIYFRFAYFTASCEAN